MSADVPDHASPEERRALNDRAPEMFDWGHPRREWWMPLIEGTVLLTAAACTYLVVLALILITR